MVVSAPITPEEEILQPKCLPQKQKRPCARIIEDETLKSATAIHLEKIAQAFITAINARNFDTSTYPYQENISSAFVGDLERPPGLGDFGLKGLEEQMRMYKYVTDMYPWVFLPPCTKQMFRDHESGNALINCGMIQRLLDQDL